MSRARPYPNSQKPPKLRDVTFRQVAPWKPLDELMTMPLRERIGYVRRNLATGRQAAPQPYLSHDDFAAALGITNRHTPIRWERDTSPARPRPVYAARIAALTPYPAAAFGAAGEEALAQESFGRRLRSLEDEVDWLRSQLVRCAAALQLELQEDPPAARSDGARR